MLSPLSTSHLQYATPSKTKQLASAQSAYFWSSHTTNGVGSSAGSFWKPKAATLVISWTVAIVHVSPRTQFTNRMCGSFSVWSVIYDLAHATQFDNLCFGSGFGTFMNWPSLLNYSHTRPLFPKRDCSKLDRLQTFFAGLFLRTMGWAGYQLWAVQASRRRLRYAN